MTPGRFDDPDQWGEELYHDWLDLPDLADDRDPLVADMLGRHLGNGPPMLTDLSVVLREGRAVKARRQALAIVSGCVAVLAVLGVGVVAGDQSGALPFLRQPGVTDSSEPDLDPEPVPSPTETTTPPPPARELVIPLTMEAQTRGTLPNGYDLVFKDDYPSDWNRSTPLPAAEAENATEWHLRFGVPGRSGGELSLSLFLNIPDANPSEASLRAGCPRPGRVDPVTGVPGCRVTRTGEGSLLVSRVTREADGRWLRTLLHYRPGDHLATVGEKVAARSYADAVHRWHYTEAQLAALARNPSLVFPDPVHRPALPKTSR